MHDGVDGGAKGHGGSDHFIARTDPQCKQSEMDGGSTAADRGRVRRSLIAREFLLELFDAGAQSNPIAAQAIDHRGDLGLANYRSAEHQPLLARAHRNATRDCRQIVILHG